MSKKVELKSVVIKLGTGSDATVLFDAFDLKIEKGDLLAIVGVSGCGKTTLLNTIAGIQAINSGEVFVFGQSPQAHFRSKNIGFAHQEHSLLGWKTVKENLEFFKNVGDTTVQGFDVEILLNLIGLTNSANSYPRELSGGMKQRVALARALVHKPELLLLDEPFASLDEWTRLKLLHELKSILLESGITSVLVSHNIEEAVLFADRIILLDGRPVEIKTDVRINRDEKSNPHVNEVVKNIRSELFNNKDL